MHIRKLILIAETPIAVARNFLVSKCSRGLEGLGMLLTLLILVSRDLALALSRRIQ